MSVMAPWEYSCDTCSWIHGVDENCSGLNTETYCGDCLIPLNQCQHGKEYKR
jgi:hypothetical protein